MKPRTATIKILDDKTGELCDQYEVPIKVYRQLEVFAKENNITLEAALEVLIMKGLNRLENYDKKEPLEAMPILNSVVEKMYNEALVEVVSPSWVPPDGMNIEGNPPPEVTAKVLVKMRLHMSQHNN